MKNLIAWVEIPSTDFDRAVIFYGKLFGTELEPLDFGTEKMACLPGDAGAVIWAQGYEPSSQGVIVSINVGEELDTIIERVQHAGGKILIPRTKIEVPGRDYFAIFTDTEGNRLGLYGK